MVHGFGPAHLECEESTTNLSNKLKADFLRRTKWIYFQKIEFRFGIDSIFKIISNYLFLEKKEKEKHISPELVWIVFGLEKHISPSQ